MSQATQSPAQSREARPARERREQHDLLFYLEQFAEENPRSALMWAFGAGFVLGWKLKPW